MKVLIADDEEEVLKGLKKIISWENLGFSICGTAENGEETLNMIQLHSPDLVLLDIRMPQYTGLEIIEKAQKSGFSGQFIILSGYSDFSYAKTAIDLNVSNYLVKPVDEDELSKAVLKAKNIILETQNTDKKLELYKNNAKNDILIKLMSGDCDISEFDPADLDLTADQYMIVYSERYNQKDIDMPWDLGQMLKTADRATNGKAIESVLIDSKEYLILKGNSIILSFYRMLRHFQGQPEQGSPLDSLFIIYGRIASDLAGLHESYSDVCQLQKRRFLCNKNQHILSMNDLPPFSKSNISLPDTTALAHRLADTVCARNHSLLAEELQNLEDTLFLCNISEHDVKEFMIDLFLQIKHILIINDEKNEMMLPGNKSIISTIEQTLYLFEIIQYFSEQLNFCSSSVKTDIMSDVLYYIDHNYKKPLKLETLAPLFGYSSSYLGKIFSKRVGENFNSYLDKVRIEHAVQLLLDDDIHIYEISEQVGYTNVDYFYRKFKKYTGLTPGDYRLSQKDMEQA